MEEYNHPECDERFIKTNSAMRDLMQHLELMLQSNKEMDNKVKPTSKFEGDISAAVTDSNFYTSIRRVAGRLSSIRRTKLKNKINVSTTRITFMRQINQSPEERIQARKERERVANSFRRLGNYEYRKDAFAVAINMYTKGMTYINDSPVLYVNRACSYIRLRSFKHAIIDCDYVLINLDPKNLRAWLYRALAYKRLGEEKNYEESIYQARRLNCNQVEFIDNFVENIRTKA